MNFVHEYIYKPFPELQVHNINGTRYYEAPNGLKYPSITSVLGKQPGKQKGLQAWRERIGEKQANIISGKAARRGTVFHHIVEDFLNNQPITTEHKEKNFLSWCMFGEAKDIIFQHIDQVILQEQSMYSDQYKVAGRCDFIGLWDNEVAVVDFKTTTTPKKREWIEDYFVQCAAYASMYEEWTQETISELIILMVAEDGHVDIFQEKTIDYLPKLEEMMDQYYTDIVDTFNAN